MKTLPTFAFLLLLSASAPAVHADSLYASPVSATNGVVPINYFSDTKAHAVGDILTIVISENVSGSSTATTTGSKSETGSFGPGIGSILSLIRTFGLSGSESSAATGTTTRADSLTATIAVTVKQVLANGNLEVVGSRTVGTNAESQTVTLTGVVRPADIGPSNTVQSPQVADAQITYSGKGPVGELQHDGIVRKIFKYLF